MLLITSLMLMLFVVNSSGQTVSVVERLPDQSYVILIDGVEHRALPPNTIRDIIKLKSDYKILQESNILLETSIKDIRKANNEFIEALKSEHKKRLEKAEYNSSFYKKQFEEEKKFRDKYADYLSKCSGKIILFRVCFF